MDIDCVTVKAFDAWDETTYKYVKAQMVECDNKNYMVPTGTVPVFDSEGNILWVVRKKEGAGR